MDLDALYEIKMLLLEEINKNSLLVNVFVEYSEKCILAEAVYPNALQSCLGSMMFAVELIDDLIHEDDEDDILDNNEEKTEEEEEEEESNEENL